MKRSRSAIALAVVASLLVGLVPASVLAQPAPPPPAPASEATKAEARDRFDRGLKLFNDGDNAGALAEFKRAYELIPNALVLYNIGLVYAAMGRPVESVDALDRVLASPTGVAPDRLSRAQQTRDEQAHRIARVTVTTNVPASVEIDNVVAGQTPMTSPLRVSGGLHVVGAVATGYAPLRKEVTVAGGETAEVKLDLVEMQGKVAHVTVKTHLPGADVVVDGQVVGKTPVPESLTVAPGQHSIELRRAGYSAARQDLLLGDGASGVVNLEPEQEAAALGAMAGTLILDATETEPVLTVDGKPLGIYPASTGLRLPAGAHHLVIERAGFLPTERDVTLDAGRATTLHVVLDATPDTLAAYRSHVSSQRTWGIVLGAGGLALAGGSVGFLVWNGQQRKTAHDDFDAAEANVINPVPNSVCDTKHASGNKDACNAPVLDAQSRINDANTRDIFGWAGLGVGVAVTGLGVVLLLTGPDAHRYDRTASRPLLLPTGWSDAHGGGVGLVGAF
ncbi:MAG TPA: PEGA domain-containing protein [Polyangiaceae bacterium]